MAVANLNFPRFRAFDSAGAPLNGGTVTVYEAGTTTKTTIWNDADKSATLSNPVTLDANGEAEIWFEGPVKVVLADSNGNQQWTIDDVKSDIPPSDVGRFNQLENGSFEIDSNGDNLPDDWTITEDDSTSTVELDSTNVSHGANSLKFVSQGSGGGTATNTGFFEVNAGKTCVVVFTIKSTVVDVRNQVQVRYFDKDQVFISADTVYDDSTTNPTSFTEKRFVSSVPATATYAKLRLIGCDPSDATSGTTYFDDVKVFTDQQAAVYSDGTAVENVKNAVTAGASGVSFPNVNANVTATDEQIDNTTKAITTQGDVILGDGSGDASRLAIGSNGQSLVSDGTTASWGSPLKFETEQAASGTSVTFTGLPAGANRITVIFENVSFDGSTDALVQIGDSGGVEGSGYTSTSVFVENATGSADISSTSGFAAFFGASGSVMSGHMVLTRISGNSWVASHTMMSNDGNGACLGGGHKDLSGELDRIRILDTGSASFDAGNFNIITEQ